MTGFGPDAAAFLGTLVATPAGVSETLEYCRVDHVSLKDPGRVLRARNLARSAAAGGWGKVEVFGEIQGPINLETVADDEIGYEPTQVVLTKSTEPGFAYFLTVPGFASALRDGELTKAAMAVWVAVDFEGFATDWTSVCPWNGPRSHDPPTLPALTPRKFVNDQTGGLAPARLDPWLLRGEAPSRSDVFAAWRTIAAGKLAFSLPSEVRADAPGAQVVLRGPRSTPIPVADPPHGWDDDAFPALAEAARWIYGTPRESETKFQFLNNHLSLDWRDGTHWPQGLSSVLTGSLTSAREAFAYHLQDQSKEAVKSLGDLRKSLQDEVAKAQSATRDLLGSVWRDFGIAGVLLALKSPNWPQISTNEALRWVTVATAAVLAVSLIVTILSNWRFNTLADDGRTEWRGKLYAFLSEADWRRLVEIPISRARNVYRIILPVIVVMYLLAIYYLLVVAVPEWIGAHVDPILIRFWQSLPLMP